MSPWLYVPNITITYFFSFDYGGKGGFFPKIKNSQYIVEMIVGISYSLQKPPNEGKGVQTHKKRKNYSVEGM